MKIELHLHTSRYSPCGRNTPQEMMERLVQEGYHIACLTEHDAVWPEEELVQLRAEFPSLQIYPGIERTLDEGEMHHLLILGTNDPVYLSLSDAGSILARAQSSGHLTVLAHPLRKMAGAPMLQAGHRPDAVEYLTPNHDSYRAWITSRMARSMGLRLVNADDAHNVNAVGRYWIQTQQDIWEPAHLRQAVVDGAYEMSWRPSDTGQERILSLAGTEAGTCQLPQT